MSIVAIRAVAQTGQLRLEFDYIPYSPDTVPIEVRVYAASHDLIYKNSIVAEEKLKVTALQPGLYTIIFYKSGIEVLEHHKVKVLADSCTVIETNLSVLEPERILVNKNKRGVTTMKGEYQGNVAFFGQTFQQGFSSQNETVKSIYAFGIKGTPLYRAANWYAIGANLSTSMGYCSLQKDRAMVFANKFNAERYYYWKASAGINNRFIFVREKEDNYWRPFFVDLGVGYNLPLIYRYVGVVRDTKTIRRNISSFNDFSATARLGFGLIGITAEYSLTRPVKSLYPDVPRLMLGIDIIIPND